MHTDFTQIPNLTVTPAQYAQLQQYVGMLLQWNRAFNLIGKSTEAQVWQRHILDCAQLVPLLQPADRVLDIGSGAGLPAVVLAVLSGAHITACEPNSKRADFLREVRRTLGLAERLTIQNSTVQDLSAHAQTYDVITARAVTSLTTLLDWANPLLHAASRMYLLKGETAALEISALWSKTNMTISTQASITKGNSAIVKLENL